MAVERAPRKVELVFFRNDAGSEPVRDWLREMGIDKLMGPGAWDSYGNPAAPSKAETK